MQLALDAAAGVPEPTAWTHVELAKLELGAGTSSAAARARPRGPRDLPRIRLSRSSRRPASTPRAAGSAPRWRPPGVRRHAVPLPAVRRAARRPARAAGQRGGARRGSGRRSRRSTGCSPRTASASTSSRAVFRADHGIRPAETVRLARRARADRPSIQGDDALGWALARAGRCAEARRWLDRALRLGTKDALLFFHRGYAAGCAGDRAAMRAWYRKALGAEPGVLRAVGPGRPGGAQVRRRVLVAALLVVAALAALARPGGASAHPLGNFTVNHYAGIELVGRPCLRPLRPRPRRDPDLPVRRPRPRAPLPGRARPSARAEARRRPHAARAARRTASRSGRGRGACRRFASKRSTELRRTAGG